MCELLCTEISHQPAISSKLHSDSRRLATYLDQEERFIPNTYAAVDEDMRGRMLETIYEAVCPHPRKSDVYHLAANLYDRYLSYEPSCSESRNRAVAGSCTMISVKLRRTQKECLSREQIRQHFSSIAEVNEKEIASRLRWNLSAVTAYDFIEELSQHLSVLLEHDQLEKLVDHSHTLANVCLLFRCFMSVPPSLLACACLCDAIQHIAQDQHNKCVLMLAELARLEPDVLLQHERNVSEVFLKKLQASGLAYAQPDESHDISVGSHDTSVGSHDTSVGSCDLSEDSITPNAIEDIEVAEFGPKFRFEAQASA